MAYKNKKKATGKAAEEKRQDDQAEKTRKTPNGPVDNAFMTRDDLDAMAKEIVGHSLEQIEERVIEDRKQMLSDMREVLRPNPETPQATKDSFRFMLGCVSSARGDLDRALKIAKEHGDEHCIRALGTATVSNGGAIVIPEFSTNFLEYLRNRSVVLNTPVNRMQMDSGFMNLGKFATGATAAYRGESSAGANSSPTFGNVSLSAKIVDVYTPASNQWLSRSPQAGSLLETHLVGALGEKTDATLIRSDGSLNRPRGLLYLGAAAQQVNETNAAGTTGGSTTAEITLDLLQMVKLLMDAKTMMSPNWLVSTNTHIGLAAVLGADSKPVFRDEVDNGRLFKFPYQWTQNIPDNLTAAAGSGGGADATEVYLYDAGALIFGETEALEIDYSRHASYTESGSQVSAWERGETLVKVSTEHDFAATRGGTEIAVKTSVTWGNA